MVTPIDSVVETAPAADNAIASPAAFSQVFEDVISKQHDKVTTPATRTNGDISPKNAAAKPELPKDQLDETAQAIATPLLTVPPVTPLPIQTNETAIEEVPGADPSGQGSELWMSSTKDCARLPATVTQEIEFATGTESKAEAADSSFQPAKLENRNSEAPLNDDTAEIDSPLFHDDLPEIPTAPLQTGSSAPAPARQQAEAVIPVEILSELEKSQADAVAVKQATSPEAAVSNPDPDKLKMPAHAAAPQAKAAPEPQPSEPERAAKDNGATAGRDESLAPKISPDTPVPNRTDTNATPTPKETLGKRSTHAPSSGRNGAVSNNVPSVSSETQLQQSDPGDTPIIPLRHVASALSTSSVAPPARTRDAELTIETPVVSVVAGHHSNPGAGEEIARVSGKPSGPVPGPEPSTHFPESFVPGGNHLLLRLERQEMRFGWSTPEFGHVEVHATLDHDRVGAVVSADSRLCDSLQSDLGNLSRALSSQSLELSYFQTSSSGSHDNAQRDQGRDFSAPARGSSEDRTVRQDHHSAMKTHAGALDLRA